MEHRTLLKKSSMLPILLLGCFSALLPEVTLANDYSVKLTWDQVNHADKYQLEEKTPGAVVFESVYTGGANSVELLQRDAGKHTYRVIGCVEAPADQGGLLCNSDVAEYSPEYELNIGETVKVDKPLAPSLASDPGNISASIEVGAIAAKLDVDANGAAVWGTSFELPKGIGGYQPSLGISYSSLSDNSVLGVGWSVNGLSSISRCRKYYEEDDLYQEVSFSEQDQLCFNGERLILKPGSTHFSNGAEYRPKMNPNLRVVFYGNESSGHFLLSRANGETWTYGKSANAKVSDQASGKNYRWLIEEKANTYSNKINFSYTGSDSITKRIDTVTYAGNKVQFEYRTRSDASKRYYQGNAILDDKLLTDVIIYNHNHVAVNSYHFSHTLSRFSSRNLLTEIKRCDGNSAGYCQQASSFDYEDNLPMGLVAQGDEVVIPLADFLNVEGNQASNYCDQRFEVPKSYCSAKDLKIGDTNGDGIMELVVMNGIGSQYQYQNLVVTADGYQLGSVTGSGEMDSQGFRGTDQAFFTFYGAGLDVVDTDGDGQDEVFLTNSFQGSVSNAVDIKADLDGDGIVEGAGRSSTAAEQHALVNYPFEGAQACDDNREFDYEVDGRVANVFDYNGDGLVDRLYEVTGTCTHGQTNEGGNLGDPVYYLLKNTSQGKTFSESPIFLDDLVSQGNTLNADVNGDGYMDISTKACATGTGFAECFAENGLIIQSFFNALSGYADINADGKDDRILADSDNRIKAYLSRYSDSNVASPAINLAGHNFSDIPDKSALSFWVDLDGDGLPALVYFDKGSQQIHVRHDANTSNRQVDGLKSVNNGMGAIAAVEYASLVYGDVYNGYTDAPSKQWGNLSPVFDSKASLYVVKQLTASTGKDANGQVLNQTTDYSYEGLRSQAGGRGSLGFAKIIETDKTLKVRTTTDYRQDYPFIGQPIKQNRAQLTSAGSYETLYEMQVTDWHQHNLLAGEVLYIQEKSRSERHFTLGGANGDVNNNSTALKTVVTSSSLELDPSYEYIKQKSQTVAQTDHASNLVSTSVTSTEYNDEDAINWRVQRPTEVTSSQTLSSGGSYSQVKRTVYNDKGRVQSQAVGETSQVSQYLKTEFNYDGFGNPTQVTRCSSHYADNCGSRVVPTDTDSDKYKVFSRVITDYDGAGRYPLSISNALFTEQSFSQYNALGLPGIITDANGVNSYHYYGPFGRSYFTASPTGAYSENRLSLCTSACPANAEFFKTLTTPNAPDSKVYFDLAGREVATSTQSMDGRWRRVDQAYDARGQLARQSTPYFEGNSGNYAYFYYDDQGRKWKEQAVDGTQRVMSWSGLTETEQVTSSHAGAYSNSDVSQTSKKTINGLAQLWSSEDANNKLVHYRYNALGLLTKTTDMDGIQIQIEFDDYGRKTQLDDPDKGQISYQYNAAGTQVGRISPANDNENSYFDAVGRLVKTETLSTAGNQTGNLYFDGVNLEYETGSEGIRRDYSYDLFGRADTVTHQADGKSWSTKNTYDNYGRVFQQFDASGNSRGVQYAYANGYAVSQAEASDSSKVYYQVTAMDPRGNVTGWTLGNGHTGIAVYDSNTGFLRSLLSSNGSLSVQDQLYEYDGLGNLRARIDKAGDANNNELVEVFSYDQLNRLTSVDFQQIRTLTLNYQANGNIASKSDMASGASYAYGSQATGCSVTPGVHALTSIGSRYKYCYDNKGNQTHSYDNGSQVRTVSYSGYDKPLQIQSPSVLTRFAYDASHQRFKRTDTESGKTRTTYYVGNNEVVEHSSGVIEYKRYIGNHVLDIVRVGGSDSTQYLHKDHIGSISVISASDGSLLQRLSYDAFGKRRDGIGWNAVQNAFANTQIQAALTITERGFTNHEHVDHANLIHMGGRIYDPETGRFVQADPIIQAPENGQSFNRYSYVFNNPLSYTDPTGYTTVGDERGETKSKTTKEKDENEEKEKKEKEDEARKNLKSKTYKQATKNGASKTQAAKLAKQAGKNAKFQSVSGGAFSTNVAAGTAIALPAASGAGELGASLSSATRFLGQFVARTLSVAVGALIPANEVGPHVGELTPEMLAQGYIEGMIARATERGEKSLTIFRTAGPAESTDIRSTGVFRLGPNEFPKQFTLTLQDAVDFQKALPTMGSQRSNNDFGLPHTVFSAQISFATAKAMTPGIITDHKRQSPILTAFDRKTLGRVNTNVLANGGIRELNTR